MNIKLKKSSKYYGVSFNKRSKKFKSYIVFQQKQIIIGEFMDEILAAQAYNKKAIELNEKHNKKYKINKLL